MSTRRFVSTSGQGHSLTFDLVNIFDLHVVDLTVYGYFKRLLKKPLDQMYRTFVQRLQGYQVS